VNPRTSVSGICTMSLDLDGQLSFWERHGIDRVGVTVRALEAAGPGAAQRVHDAGLTVTNVLGHGCRLDERSSWEAHRDLLIRSMAAATQLQAQSFVLTTGCAATLSWEEAADRLHELLAPVLPWSACPVLVEHTHALRADVGFVHTLHDALDLAEQVGLDGVLLEVQACWAERGLGATIADRVAGVGLVQISDYRIGTTTTPHRLVPGDGDLPLARIIAALEKAGYTGCYDLELIGPAIEAEGYDSAVPRAVAALQELLQRSG
jgi:sugar phosphate isomerase/epimerase